MNNDFIKSALGGMMDQYMFIGKELQKDEPNKDMIKQRLKKAESFIRIANQEILKSL